MSLADALEAHKVSKPGPVCSICVLLKTLDKDDATALTAALTNPAYTHNAITRALRAEGHPVNASSVGRHRKGECAGVNR